MAGTNAVLVKTALLTLFRTALGPAAVNGQQIRVDDAYNGRLSEREYVYFGHITGHQEPLAFRGGRALPRMEELLVPVHIEVALPNATTIDTDTAAVAIGTQIENAIAADPTQAALQVPGLLAVWVSSTTLTPFYMADGVAATEAVYTLTVQSNLG